MDTPPVNTSNPEFQAIGSRWIQTGASKWVPPIDKPGIQATGSWLLAGWATRFPLVQASSSAPETIRNTCTFWGHVLRSALEANLV